MEQRTLPNFFPETPAEACGIKVEGENKWITLIQNASHQPKIDSIHHQPKT